MATAKAWLVEQLNLSGKWVPVQVELLRSRITVEDWREVKRAGDLPPRCWPASFRITPLVARRTRAAPGTEHAADEVAGEPEREEG